MPVKYCPYCGAEILSGAFSFCPECGSSLSVSEESNNPVGPLPEKKRSKQQGPQKSRREKHLKKDKSSCGPSLLTEDSGYDGYYEDVQPVDADRQREGLDTKLILRVVLLMAGVALVIGGCVAALFLL